MNVHVVTTSTRKDFALEGLRGLASVTVLVWHLILGFYPELLGDYGQVISGSGIRGHFWFGLVYGSSAVTLFFVLSGYVLTLRYFESGGDLRIIQRSAIKRWPRLAGPVLLAVLLSWAIGFLGLYRYVEGGAITKSQWLIAFANGAAAPGFSDRSLADALGQGMFLTFFRGDSYFDTNIWTMRLELIGSFTAFGMAPILIGLRPVAAAVAIFVTVMLCNYSNIALIGFPVGVAMALVRAQNHAWEWKVPIAAIAMIAAIYLAGYSGIASHDYAWLGKFNQIYAHCAAAILAISAIELCPQVNSYFSTRFARLLGEMSFPLYLAHIPVLCSVGCGLLIESGSRALAIIGVIITSFVLAAVLAIANARWLRLLNAAASNAGSGAGTQ